MKKNHIVILVLLFCLLMFFRRKSVLVPVGVIAIDPLTNSLHTELKTRITNLETLYSNSQIMIVNQLSNLTFPLRKGIIQVNSDTSFSDTPQVQFYYSDGNAASSGDLITAPMDKLSNLI